MRERAEQRLVEQLIPQAAEVSSVPLSLTIVPGLPRSTSRRSNSRATRMPEIEVSATNARPSRAQSSAPTRMRMRRPSMN
jgi:hypothetical protein